MIEMEYEPQYHKKMLCANCGKLGHEFKICHEPITSFGIINIKILDRGNESLIIKDQFSTKKKTYYKITSKKYPDIICYISNNIKIFEDQDNKYKLDSTNIPYENEEQFHKFCYYKDRILFQMVSRRFSLGFIEFLRGKYDVSDAKTIINLFEQMYENEIQYIAHHKYDDLLYYFLNRHNEPKETVLNRIYEGRYSNEYCEAKIKFNMLAKASDDDHVPWSLNFYIKHIKPRWKIPEWGFPKGRRDKKTEENLHCACREFEEETGYKSGEYTILNQIEPIEEKLVGTNGVSYKHIYYLAMNNHEEEDNFHEYDTYEIGEVTWFTYDEAIDHIRPYHLDKKNILTKVYLFILNYLIHNYRSENLH